MKHIIKTLAITLIIACATWSFTTIKNGKKTVNVKNTNIVWKGYKVVGSHQGTVKLKSGFLTFNEDVLTEGEFIIDMASITCTDLEGEYKNNLEGHLKSNDFFGVEKHPTSSLTFKKVKTTGKNSYKITADLTIKGKTNPVTLNFSVYGNKANATLKIDRTKFDIKYSSASFFDGLKDKAIYDEFDLIVDLEF